MNIEDLKLILEAVQGISGMGLNVAYGYIAMAVLDRVLSFGLGAAVVVMFYKSIRFITSCFSASEKLRIAAGVDYGFNDCQLSKACRVLEKHYNEQ